MVELIPGELDSNLPGRLLGDFGPVIIIRPSLLHGDFVEMP